MIPNLPGFSLLKYQLYSGCLNTSKYHICNFSEILDIHLFI